MVEAGEACIARTIPHWRKTTTVSGTLRPSWRDAMSDLAQNRTTMSHPFLCRVADAGQGTHRHAPTVGVGNWPRDGIAGEGTREGAASQAGGQQRQLTPTPVVRSAGASCSARSPSPAA